MQEQTCIRIHRFRHLIAIDSPGIPDSIYMSAGLAEDLAAKLQAYAADVRDRPFSRSRLGTSYATPREILGGAHPGEAYRKAAARRYEREGECEIDDGALISHGGDEGAYVQAWVWVYDDEARLYDTNESD